MADANDAKRDGNYITSMLFMGSDGLTYPCEGDEVTGRLLVDLNGNSITGSGTANQIAYFTASSVISSLTTATYPSLTELSYVKGVTSAIQTQINAKMTNPMTTGGDIIYGGASGTPTRLANGSAGQVLTSAGTTLPPTWETPSSSVPTTITVANEATDTSCFLAFFTAATGDLGPKTNVNMTFNSNTGVVTFASSVLTTTDINGGTIDGAVIGGASAAAITGTVITANTSVLPDTDGGAALGSATLGFSILGLASASTINFANGNVVLTHSSGILTVTTGDLRITTAGTNSASAVTVGGVQTLTNKTLTSPAINTSTLGGHQTMAENAALLLDPALSADGTYNGIVRGGTAGATLAFGDLCYLDPTDSRWELADANAAAGADGDARGILGICVLAAASDGSATTMLLQGIVRADTAFPSMTVNNQIYVSETAGDITGTQPTTTDVVIRVVGQALTADELYFNPSPDYITHT